MFEAAIKQILADLDAIEVAIRTVRAYGSKQSDETKQKADLCLNTLKEIRADMKSEYDRLIDQAVEEAEVLAMAYEDFDFEDETY